MFSFRNEDLLPDSAYQRIQLPKPRLYFLDGQVLVLTTLTFQRLSQNDELFPADKGVKISSAFI